MKNLLKAVAFTLLFITTSFSATHYTDTIYPVSDITIGNIHTKDTTAFNKAIFSQDSPLLAIIHYTC